MKRTTQILITFVLLITIIPITGPSESIVYHQNKVIDELINNYNLIAEYPISLEMVRNGARKNNANASCNEVWVQMWETRGGNPSIDFDLESKPNDMLMFPLFRDFTKVLMPDISDKEIEYLWNELKTEKYGAYNSLYYEDLRMNYWSQKLNNGEYRYGVTLELNNKH